MGGDEIMKVLIINLRIGTGSVGRIVSDLYHGVIDSENKCKVAYARGDTGDIPKEDAIKICSDFEVKKHALLTRVFGNTAFWSKKSTKDFLEEVDVFSPDIIHIHGLYGYYINMNELFNYIKRKHIKLVSTLHSCWDFTGHCCYFDYDNCIQWKSGCHNCAQKKSYPKSSFLDNTNKNYIRKMNLYNSIDNCIIVTPSEWLANLARESFLNKHKILVINNGVDTSKFKSTFDETVINKYSIDSNKKIILCVASIWDRRKGLEDVIELSHRIDESLQIVVVGVNDKQIEELPSNIIAIKRTNNIYELSVLYSVATILFNPTYEDNYPTVNLEAMACGTPVVTYNTGGSGEIVKKSKLGIVVDKKDYVHILEYINHVTSISFDRFDSMDISEKQMIKKYLELYNRMR